MQVSDESMEYLNQPLNPPPSPSPRSSSGGTTHQAEYTFEELKAIELRRREILRRAELPYWRILTYMEGTCLRALSSDWLLWLTLAVFVLVRLQAWSDGVLPDFARELGHLNIDVIGGFLSFFLVLFVNQSNARFQEMYKESMNGVKRICDVACSVATALPKPQAQRLVRYLNAAHAAGYVGLGPTYSEHHFFLTVNASYALLSESELARIREIDMDHGPAACQELVEWCMHDIDRAYKNKFIEAKDFAQLRGFVLQFRASMEVLYDFTDQPIHFFYIHFLCLLSALYLPLFAVSNAYKAGAGDEVHWSADVLSGLIVLMQTIFVIGLRMLGRKMVDPYGDDLEDLSVLRFVKTAWLRSNRILATRFPGEVSPELEEQLERQKKASLGEPWQSLLRE